MTDYIRLSLAGLEDRHDAGIGLCDHVSLPNAYTEPLHDYEYDELLKVRCEECDTEYEFILKVN